jgi:hypothetical protein
VFSGGEMNKLKLQMTGAKLDVSRSIEVPRSLDRESRRLTKRDNFSKIHPLPPFQGNGSFWGIV